ncbi:Iron-containing alcohol dehydrogenase 1 [Mycena indigotica]|uniref:Iron-containing alcohol dehydrogenase 1 n=1 Tax=Mycena indigotica TaxID=2126181 RepID=A0A8H6VWB1_9AGAR|nr:Iron-containing alcohol dehydrogenase 1 [Mycena indigotica]KAF7290589.1 Iron-containing alcohol dehydrogenase 1 [Mycena indigotica]
MTDLTYSYIHMTDYELQTLDTLETPEYLKDELITDDLNIPAHMVPPDPDDSDILPSKAHPSYPYGNPLNPKHPASRPRPPYDPFSRALFEDMGYAGAGVNGAHRWKDLAMEMLLPVDEVREEKNRAIEARKMASGSGAAPTGAQPAGMAANQEEDEEDEEQEDEQEEEEDDDDDDNDDEDSEEEP